MLLKEFIYFDKSRRDMADDNRYDSKNDTSVLGKDDLRKVRLTLRMLNDLRKAGDAREVERVEELGLIRKMYALPPATETPPV